MSNRLHFLYILLSVLIFAERGTALECYDCSSQRNSACGDSLDISKIETTECKNKELCYKVIKPTTEVNGVIIERGCSPASYCHSLSIPCDLCESKLCNSSPAVMPSFFVAAIVSLVYCLNYL